MEEEPILPMFTSQEAYLYVNYCGQLIFLQENYLLDIEGIACVPMMGGLIFSPKTQQISDMYNYYLN